MRVREGNGVWFPWLNSQEFYEGLFYFTCSEEFLLLLRVRGMELDKKTKLWGVSRDCYFTCQGKDLYKLRYCFQFLTDPLKSKPFWDQWSKETNLVDLELSCVYLAKLEMHFPEFPSVGEQGFPSSFASDVEGNISRILLRCWCRKQGTDAATHRLPSVTLVICYLVATSAPTDTPFLPVWLQGQVDDVMLLEAVRSWETHVLLSSWFPALFHSFLLQKKHMFVIENLEHTES